MPESPFQIILLRIWAFQILDKFSCMLCQHPNFFFLKTISGIETRLFWIHQVYPKPKFCPRIFPAYFKVNLLLWKISRGYVNEAVSLVEFEVTFKMTLISTNKIALFRFPQKIFLDRKLIFTLTTYWSCKLNQVTISGWVYLF